MGDSIFLDGQARELAQRLLDQIEAADEAGARGTLDELTTMREGELYQQVGKLTRQLHEALNNFQFDDRLANIAQQEIPDARERLNYVIDMTQQAANRTLAAVEESGPLCDDIERSAERLSEAWARFTGRQMNADEFRGMSRELADFLHTAPGHVNTIRGHLTEVLMAQGFQDLTGQIIKRVINLVEEVELNLVNLVSLTGQKVGEAPEADDPASLEGPPVPGVSKGDLVSSQDDVDDLLSSLGF